jgi:hypothetical protein
MQDSERLLLGGERVDDHAGEHLEARVDVHAVLGRRLEIVPRVQFTHEISPLLLRHLPVTLEVDLVSDQDGRGCRLNLLEDLIAPAVEVLERLGTGDVEDVDDAGRALVERVAHRAEMWLAGEIPKLEADVGVFLLGRGEDFGGDELQREIATYRHDVLVLELLLGEHHHQARLPDRPITNDDGLEDITALHRRH